MCTSDFDRTAGKKVPKRLVQARAKWSFHQRGMPEFKVRQFHQIYS